MIDLAATMAGSGIGTGWARGGRNLARAGGGSQQQVYDAAMSRRHQLEKQLAEARIARDEDLARQETTAKLTEYTKNPELAEALSTLIRGAGGNFDQVTQGIGNLQDQGYQRQAADLMMAGDLEQGNAALAASQGKPLELTKITGNTAYNPYVTPDAAQLMTTPYGEGVLGNQRYRTDTQATTQRQRSAATAAKSQDPAKLEERAIKDLARDAYYALRADGVDTKGITLGDIEHGLRTEGKWTAPNGSVVHFGGDTGAAPESAAAAMSGAAPTGPSSRPRNRPAAAAPAAPASRPPVPNARQASDGNWYIPDPDRPGKYLRVDG